MGGRHAGIDVMVYAEVILEQKKSWEAAPAGLVRVRFGHSDGEKRLGLNLRRHILDHFVRQILGDLFEARFDEHVAAGAFVARFPNRRPGRGIDQAQAQPHPPDVITFLSHVFPGIDSDHQKGINVERFPKLNRGVFIGLTGHFKAGKIKHE